MSRQPNSGNFPKGNLPWNKNKKGIHLSPDSEFKKDQFVGENHPSWKGGIQQPKNDCVHLYTGNGQRVRKPRKIYEDNFGSIPEGYVVIHLDGNKLNDEPNNLLAISRAQLVRFNNGERIWDIIKIDHRRHGNL